PRRPAMPLYRCLNPACPSPAREFTADAPVCPGCKVDARVPKFRAVVVPLVTIHFDPPSAVPGIGLNVLACRPDQPVNRFRASGSARAVNCPACKRTEAWKKQAEIEADVGDVRPTDMLVTVDGSGTVRRC